VSGQLDDLPETWVECWFTVSGKCDMVYLLAFSGQSLEDSEHFLGTLFNGREQLLWGAFNIQTTLAVDAIEIADFSDGREQIHSQGIS
jgi:hypothetical protein